MALECMPDGCDHSDK